MTPVFNRRHAVARVKKLRQYSKCCEPSALLFGFGSRETLRDEKAVSSRSSGHFCGGVRAVLEPESTCRYKHKAYSMILVRKLHNSP